MLLELNPEDIYEYIHELNQEADAIKESMFDLVIMSEGAFGLNDAAILSSSDKKILNKSITKYNNEIAKQTKGKTTLTNNY